MLFNRYALTTLREGRGLTRAQLASEAGVSAPYITQMETGARSTPSKSVLASLCRVLECGDERIFYIEPTLRELAAELELAIEREMAA